MEEYIAINDELVTIERRQDYIAQRKWTYDPGSRTTEEILGRFPVRHSCQHCTEDILNALRPTSSIITSLRNVDSAIRAAEDDCTFYEWLLDFMIRSEAKGDLVGREFFSAKIKSLSQDINDVHSVQFCFGTKAYSWPITTFDVFAEEGNAAASCISSRPFNRHVGSSTSFQLARQWLRECCNSHDECRSTATGVLPTRLVNLKISGIMDAVNVISSHSLRFTGRIAYATLSYCWGGEQAVKTSKSNLRRHEINISLSELGQSLRDAIKVARSLGLAFLWIDSLCIVQDDPEDVATEISRTSEYYENAHVCILAASAASCNEGFLQSRSGNPYRHGPFELPYRGHDNDMGSIKIVTYSDYSRNLEPVNARAWIMQETLLAPRLLSYGYRNLTWSCRRNNHSDGGPNWKWHDFSQRENWKISRREGQGDHMSNIFSIIGSWKELVESYSKRSLTKASDKFPAISGLAKKYAQTLSFNYGLNYNEEISPPYDPARVKYLAGIWSWGLSNPGNLANFKVLCLQLFWITPLFEFRFSNSLAHFSEAHSRRLGAASVHRFREYIAPSWSWAAIDGPVIYEDWSKGMFLASSFRILDARVSTEIQSAPYGAVGSGWLTVMGRMRQVVPGTDLDEFGAIYRPDTEEDNKDLYKVIKGKDKGWLLEVAAAGGDTKDTGLPWKGTTPKGLILVKDRDCFRRIGVYSIEKANQRIQVLSEEVTQSSRIEEAALATFFDMIGEKPIALFVFQYQTPPGDGFGLYKYPDEMLNAKKAYEEFKLSRDMLGDLLGFMQRHNPLRRESSPELAANARPMQVMAKEAG